MKTKREIHLRLKVFLPLVAVAGADQESMNVLSGPQVSTTLNRVKTNLRQAGLPVAAFAEIVGCPLSSLKAALAGRLYIGSEREAAYLTISVRCLNYMMAFRPFLTFREWSGLNRLLDSDLTPEQVASMIESVFGSRE